MRLQKKAKFRLKNEITHSYCMVANKNLDEKNFEIKSPGIFG